MSAVTGESTSNKSILEKIEQLKKDRDAFAIGANNQIFAFNGAIRALEELLAPPAPAGAQADASDVVENLSMGIDEDQN
jgi:hypothetical protein